MLCLVHALGEQFSCGEGIGDLRRRQGAAEACTRCKGSGAFLGFDQSAADGIGYTTCFRAGSNPRFDLPLAAQPRAQPQSQPTARPCGEGVGDLRAAVDGETACKRCRGARAVLSFSATADDGMGYTSCDLTTASTTSAPAAAPAEAARPASRKYAGNCGEGAGDLRGSAAAAAECTLCNGPGAFLTFEQQRAGGLGFTRCQAAMSDTLVDELQAATDVLKRTSLPVFLESRGGRHWHAIPTSILGQVGRDSRFVELALGVVTGLPFALLLASLTAYSLTVLRARRAAAAGPAAEGSGDGRRDAGGDVPATEAASPSCV